MTERLDDRVASLEAELALVRSANRSLAEQLRMQWTDADRLGRALRRVIERAGGCGCCRLPEDVQLVLAQPEPALTA